MTENRKEKVAAFNRAMILDTASQLFLEKGVDGTTMDDIAKEAEYSKTSLYAYFTNKDDLVHHLILEGMELFKNTVREDAEQSGTLEEFFMRLCQSILDLREKHPLYYSGISGDIPDDSNVPPEHVLSRIGRSGKVINRMIEARIEKALADREITLEDDIPETVLFLWFCIMGIIEKSEVKGRYIHEKAGKSKQEFMHAAFTKLFQMLFKK